MRDSRGEMAFIRPSPGGEGDVTTASLAGASGWCEESSICGIYGRRSGNFEAVCLERNSRKPPIGAWTSAECTLRPAGKLDSHRMPRRLGGFRGGLIPRRFAGFARLVGFALLAGFNRFWLDFLDFDAADSG